MVKRPKLQNAGDESEVDPAAVVGEDFGAPPPGQEEAEVTQAGNEATDEPTVEADANGDTEQDVADQEAAGVNTTVADDKATIARNKRAMMREVAVAGADFGAGKTSMIRLAEIVTEAAMNGIISVEHAEEIYDKFRAEADKKGTIDEAGLVPDEALMENPAASKGDDKSKAQQLSKLRAFIKLGNKFDTDASDIVRRARNMHLGLLAGDRKTLKPGSTYNVLYAVATAQMKHATSTKTMHVFTDDELLVIMSDEAKGDRPDPTGADKILDALKSAVSARKGTAERAPTPSEELDNAIQWLEQALAATNPELLSEYEQQVEEAEKKKVEAEAKRAEAAAVKAARALEPKPAKAAPAAKPAAKKAA